MGEFLGFIMGWDLILEYIISTASVGNAMSQYIDIFTGKQISSFLLSTVPMNVAGLGPYPDVLAFILIILMTGITFRPQDIFHKSLMHCILLIGLMVVGVKESTTLNKIFTIVNIVILSFIIVCGATQVNFSNWQVNTANLKWVDVDNKNQSCPDSARCGTGGFFPYGLNGVINGAAKCFYAFIGFTLFTCAIELK